MICPKFDELRFVRAVPSSRPPVVPPDAGFVPVALHRFRGDAQRQGGFVYREAAEIDELHHQAEARGFGREFLEARSTSRIMSASRSVRISDSSKSTR